MKSINNRKTIPLKRRTLNQPDLKNKLINFEPDLHQNIQTYLSLERQKLQNLDKISARRLISEAEKSLIYFLRSKAKVNCFKPRDQNRPFHQFTFQPSMTSKTIFDIKKLSIEIEKQQKKRRGNLQKCYPLVEDSMRKINQSNENKRDLNCWYNIIQQHSEDKVYCSLSSKRKNNKTVFY